MGGGTRIPKIQEILYDYLGKELKKDLNTDEASALGAAFRAANESDPIYFCCFVAVIILLFLTKKKETFVFNWSKNNRKSVEKKKFQNKLQPPPPKKKRTVTFFIPKILVS